MKKQAKSKPVPNLNQIFLKDFFLTLREGGTQCNVLVNV